MNPFPTNILSKHNYTTLHKQTPGDTPRSYPRRALITVRTLKALHDFKSGWCSSCQPTRLTSEIIERAGNRTADIGFPVSKY